jgi:hypothetical protein
VERTPCQGQDVRRLDNVFAFLLEIRPYASSPSARLSYASLASRDSAISSAPHPPAGRPV